MTNFQKKTLKFLYKNYYQDLIKIAKNILKQNYYSVPLDPDDLVSYSTFEFTSKWLSNFNPAFQIGFKEYFFIKNKFLMLNYCSKFASKNHQILNNSNTFNDDILVSDKNKIYLDFSDLSDFEMRIINCIYYENKNILETAKYLKISPSDLKNKLIIIHQKMRKHSYSI
ncbi:MAG: hypothetical protein ACRCRZ_01485 [Metamycoplasmataceae bacterium]